MEHDGNGNCLDANDQRRWGLFGAAGLLLRAPDTDGTPLVLMQHRALWTDSGDTWGIPGGAQDSHETSTEAALRETHEETHIEVPPHRVRWDVITATFPYTRHVKRSLTPTGTEFTWHGRTFMATVHDHEGLWTYTTVGADLNEPASFIADRESEELAWVREDDVDNLTLIPAFAHVWPGLRTAPADLIIDLDSLMAATASSCALRARSDASQMLSIVANNAPWVWRRDDTLSFLGEDNQTITTPTEPGFWWTATTTAVFGRSYAGAKQKRALPFVAQSFFHPEEVTGTAAEAIEKMVLDNVAQRRTTIVVTDSDPLREALPVNYTQVIPLSGLGI